MGAAGKSETFVAVTDTTDPLDVEPGKWSVLFRRHTKEGQGQVWSNSRDIALALGSVEDGSVC